MPSTDKNRTAAESDEKLRRVLRTRIADLRISAREASRRAGFNVGYVGDILEGRSKVPERDRILRLAEALQFDPADLLSDSGMLGSYAGPDSLEAAEVLPFGMDPREGGRMIPLYATDAMPIPRQFLHFSETPMGRVPAPSALLGTPSAYAVRVPNDSAAPRFFAGETVFVKPGDTARIGDFVFVRRPGGDAGIARLAELGGTAARFAFIGLQGDDSEAEIPFADLESMHRIIGMLV